MQRHEYPHIYFHFLNFIFIQKNWNKFSFHFNFNLYLFIKFCQVEVNK